MIKIRRDKFGKHKQSGTPHPPCPAYDQGNINGCQPPVQQVSVATDEPSLRITDITSITPSDLLYRVFLCLSPECFGEANEENTLCVFDFIQLVSSLTRNWWIRQENWADFIWNDVHCPGLSRPYREIWQQWSPATNYPFYKCIRKGPI